MIHNTINIICYTIAALAATHLAGSALISATRTDVATIARRIRTTIASAFEALAELTRSEEPYDPYRFDDE